MHPPACMNGRKELSRPKNGRILPLFGGLKSESSSPPLGLDARLVPGLTEGLLITFYHPFQRSCPLPLPHFEVFSKYSRNIPKIFPFVTRKFSESKSPIFFVFMLWPSKYLALSSEPNYNVMGTSMGEIRSDTHNVVYFWDRGSMYILGRDQSFSCRQYKCVRRRVEVIRSPTYHQALSIRFPTI